MRIWNDLAGDSKIFQGGVVTLGNFDGLHIGHQALMNTLSAEAGPRVVMTFTPHPVTVLRPEIPFQRLMPEDDLAEALSRYPIDLFVRIPFTKELAQLSPDEFFDQKILTPFRPRLLVVGYDFALGHGRSGDLRWLQKFSEQRSFSVRQVPPVIEGGAPVSSRRLRELVERGDMGTVKRWLGRPFYVRGQVIAGAGRGRGLGVPTINLAVEKEVVPANGVYVTRTKWAKKIYPSVTNVGVSPTFSGESIRRVETHILDQKIDLYGQTVDVQFERRLRDEMRFSDVESLKKQIERDILEARRELREE